MWRDHLDGVGRGAAVVGLGLDLGGRVDVHDDDRAGMRGLPVAQLLGGDRVGQRAAGVEVGDQHALVRAQDRGGLGHEVHAAEHDRLGVGARRPAARARASRRRSRPRPGSRAAGSCGRGSRRRARRPAPAPRPAGRGCSPASAGRRWRPASEGSWQIGSRIRDRSSAGALWVSAPTETKSTPVLATSRSVSSVTPPLASSSARPATCATAARSCAGFMLSSRIRGRPGGQRLVDLGQRAALDLERQLRARPRGRAAPPPPPRRRSRRGSP